MKELEFDEIVEERIKKIKTTLIEKGKSYRRNNDVFHNFEVGAKITNQSREKVLYGFLLKHLISFQDIVNDVEANKLPTIETLEEKIGDILCYVILAEASIKDKIQNSAFLNNSDIEFKKILENITHPLKNSQQSIDNTTITHT